MSLIYPNRYPDRYDPQSTSYPQGKFRNRSTPEAHDGGYFEQDLMNDWAGFFGALLKNGGVVPNGVVDTALNSQYYDAMMRVVGTQSIISVSEGLDISGKSVNPTEGSSGTGSHHSFGKLPSGMSKSGGYVVIGSGNLANSTSASGCVAIGDGVFRNGVNPRLSEAVGLFSQMNSSADRNTSLGSLSLAFMSTGRYNVAVGRNAGQCVNGNGNTSIGYRAMAGDAPISFDNKIKPLFTLSGSSNVAVGTDSLLNIAGSSNTNVAVGTRTLYNVKSLSSTVAIGDSAGQKLGVDESFRGRKVEVNVQRTYTFTNGLFTIPLVNNVEIGSIGRCSITPSEIFGTDPKFLEIIEITSTNIVAKPYFNDDVNDIPNNTTGSVNFDWIEVTGTVRVSESFVLIGSQAADQATQVTKSVVSGARSCLLTERILNSYVGGYNAGRSSDIVIDSVCIGTDTAIGSTRLQGTVAIGSSALNGTNSVEFIDSTFIGSSTGRGLTGRPVNVTCVGSNAGRTTALANLTNSTMLGNGANVTGDNQVQLGNASTQTYVYGTVQNRSDMRDKRDVKELELGLDFVMKLKPKQFKWDYREWQGKRTGKRDHVGFIAQELQDTLKDTNYAFVQDHSVNGGSDVLSVGYDEFIGVLTKAIQEQQQQIKLLQMEVSELSKLK